MKTLLFAALVISGMVAVGPAAAQYQETRSLISPVAEQSSMAENNSSEPAMPMGVHHIVYNSALARSPLHSGAPVQMTLPDGTNILFDFESSRSNPSGSVTWVGQLADSSLPYKAIITDDGEHVFGRIVTPEGEYLLRTSNGIQQLINPRAAGLQESQAIDDVLVAPETLLLSENQTAATPTVSAESTASSEMVTVDLLLAYSTGLADELGGGLQTRLDQLVALANQAYKDSEIYLRLRVVHSVEVDYSDTETQNGKAVYHLTPNVAGYTTPPSLEEIANLRWNYGADLVALIRRHSSVLVNCGAAWVNGSEDDTVLNYGHRYKHRGYSVISIGTDSNTLAYCGDFTLAHELGHNMGSAHDRDNVVEHGVFPYSYGYGDAGEFGTVMSYITPKVMVFSSPNLDCFGQPCGIADPHPESADNVRSINNTRFEVAKFQSTKVPESCDTLMLDYASVSGVVTKTSCAIIAGPSYTVSSTAEVAFVARESIAFRSGFQVAIGAQFGATMDPWLAP